MEKLDLTTPNFTDENIQKLSELFPNCVTESADGKAIDFDALKQELSSNIVEGNKERYQLTWPGKAESLVTANRSINKTLGPVREESKDFDNTENLYIEGDNLEVLKLLQETYLGKIKMIYIDPPYNTGKDFVYKDNFTQDKAGYDEESGNIDAEGGRLVSNPDSNGRYHSDWLSMMFPRLRLAKNLLRDDGVVFISIDDGECVNILKLCDEIFGKNNFVSKFIINSAPAGTQSSTHVAQQHSYCIAYSKTDLFESQRIPLSEKELFKKYSEEDNNGRFYPERLWKRGIGGKKEDVPTLHFPVYYDKNEDKIYIDDEVKKNDNLIKIIPYQTKGVLGRWTWSKKKMKKDRDSLLVKVIANEYKLHSKKYIHLDKGRLAKSVIDADIGRTELGSIETKEIFNAKVFDYPKYSKLIRYFINLSTRANKNDLILDFFSGSATTAHAVMQLNAEDGGNRKFIMAQIPEVTDEKSEAYKAGYKTIAEIGKERIRRAGEKIKEAIDDLDVGFRVLKVDSSNMKDVYFSPDNTSQEDMFDLASNIKEDRSDEDLLFMVLLDWGIDLSVKIERREVVGKIVYFADDNFLAACFEENLDEDFVKALVTENPLKVVLRDSGFASSSVKINVEQIFKQADIEVKVI